MNDAVAALGYVSAMMEMQAAGIPVHMLINLALAAVVTLRGGWWTCKTARRFCRWLFVRKPARAEVVIDEAPPAPAVEEGSEAYHETIEALCSEHSTYDPEKHHLMCEGLLVVFGGETEFADVVSLIGCPGPHPTEKGEFVGVKLEALLSDEEKRLVIDHARELRAEVKRRDLELANQRAALAMRHERLKNRIAETYAGYESVQPAALPSGGRLDESQKSQAKDQTAQAPLRSGPVPVLNRSKGPGLKKF